MEAAFEGALELGQPMFRCGNAICLRRMQPLNFGMQKMTAGE